MYTLYKLNSDEPNENFIAAMKAQFPHQTIEISISEVQQVEQDEMAYLLGNPANRSRLLAAITQVENNQFIDVDLEKL